MASQVSLEIIGHSLCPYTQRVLYVATHKKVSFEFNELDLSQKPKWFFEISPAGKIPALKVIINGQQVNLYDSFPLCEYIDSLPGPGLYPRDEFGSIDHLKKVQIDMVIRGKIDVFQGHLAHFWKGKVSESQLKQSKDSIKELNEMLRYGYLMTSLLEKNEITMGDVMLFPFIERVNAMRNEYWQDLVRGLDLKHLWRWYEELTKIEWINKHLANPKRLRKIQSDIHKGEYKGLKLPLTYYDTK